MIGRIFWLFSEGYMDSVQMMTADYFLPLERMQQLAVSAHQTYATAKPYPHIVFDNFFNPELLDVVLSEFPKPGAIRWQSFNNEQEVKLASAAEATFGPTTRLFMYHLNSITFLNFLSAVTGVENLIPDPSFEGGGLHQIMPGGKLGVHADFNKHGKYNLDRRLNLLLYLNKNWREEYGGNLELWDRDMTSCQARVLPIFNRVMVFTTTDYTYHGHPDALMCPEGMTRKSLALYYFSNGRPATEIDGEHSTIFRERYAGEYAPPLSGKLRKLATNLLPPIVARRFKSLR
jgi:Rps23 Pro-64 3,4-dihydroxylase Tpa1-like proline 4-hydroxylase